MSVRYFSLFLLLSIFSVHVLAGEASGKVASYIAHKGDIFFFTLNTNENNKPACNTAGGSSGRFVVSTKTQDGKDIMTSIINAKNANLDVFVSGTGSCTIWPDSEDVSYVQVSGQSAMIGPKGPKGDIGAKGNQGNVGPQGPKGDKGDPGPAIHTSSVCSAIGTCNCTGGRVLSLVGGPCAVTSDTGPCSQNGANGSCCVCAPQ